VRTVRTFILRLLVDPSEPAALRGVLQPIPEGAAQSFTDARELLATLRNAIAPAETAATDQISDASGEVGTHGPT